MVKILMFKFSELLYFTTASGNPVPVRIPFTIRKGINKIAYTETAFPSQSTLKINFKKKQTKAQLINVTEV